MSSTTMRYHYDGTGLGTVIVIDNEDGDQYSVVVQYDDYGGYALTMAVRNQTPEDREAMLAWPRQVRVALHRGALQMRLEKGVT